MGTGWEALERELENDLSAISEAILKEIGQAIGTIRPVYFSESSVGGYGILFGNTFGMILAHILLVLIGISDIVGFIVIIKWLFTHKKMKMTPGEKWLKTGRID